MISVRLTKMFSVDECVAIMQYYHSVVTILWPLGGHGPWLS